MFPLYFIFLTFLLHLSSQKSYFCDLSCPKGTTHTVCKYEPCSPHNNCGEKFKSMQLNDEERTYITAVHNHFRQTVAAGNDTRGGNGEATNMRALSYSKELEFVAQCWTNRCNQEGAHDKCRSIKDFPAVGQNMYMKTVLTETDQEDLKRAVEAWYSEIEFTNENIINNFPEDVDFYKYGHFTQVVWAKTQYIGCGRTVYGTSDSMNVLIICNYATSGNFIDESVYERGEKCSNCDGLKCVLPFDALCGQPRPIKEDNWKEPFTQAASSVKAPVGIILLLLIVGISCN